MFTRRRLMRTLPFAAGALWGCSEPAALPVRYRLPKKPLLVVTSTVQAADLVRAVGGVAVNAISLVAPLANPHLWQPVASDYAALQLADAFFLSGLGLESRFTADLDQLRAQGQPVGVLANALSDEDILKRANGSPDPHFWMDPRLWAKAVKEVVAVLSQAYPKASLWFSDRGHEFANTLGEIHANALRQYEIIPARSRFLFTSHASMAYFGAAYQMETRSLADAAGAAPAAFSEELTSWLSGNNVRTLFREHFADLKTIRGLGRSLKVNSDPQIFSLSLAKPGTKLAGLSSEMEVDSFVPAFRYTAEIIKDHIALE